MITRVRPTRHSPCLAAFGAESALSGNDAPEVVMGAAVVEAFVKIAASEELGDRPKSSVHTRRIIQNRKQTMEEATQRAAGST